MDLTDDEDEKNFDMNFLTHKGKRLEDIDDFRDHISDDDEFEDKDLAKGIMNEEMVNALHFGGGEEVTQNDLQQAKKTREERHAEIMEKSKAYRLHRQEIKLAA